MTLTYKDVSEILKIIDASECEEVVLELEGTRLVIRRGGAAQGTSAAHTVSAAASAAPVAPAPAPQVSASQPPPSLPQPTPATSGAAGSRSPAQEPQGIDGEAVRAPMVGTFYRRPSPEEPPFVEVGSAVKAGDALCLIEVMKLFTTLEAPVDGVVKSVSVEDGQGVEFDQLLFVIAPE